MCGQGAGLKGEVAFVYQTQPEWKSVFLKTSLKKLSLSRSVHGYVWLSFSIDLIHENHILGQFSV